MHHGDLEAVAIFAEAVGGRERAVVEVEDDRAAAADAELDLLAAHREARCAARHHERRHALQKASPAHMHMYCIHTQHLTT